MPDVSPRSSLFQNKDFSPDRFASDMEKQPAPRSFGILFTPRSGSSWLTDILSQTKHLGKPREWFNPNFVPNITRSVNSNTLDGYIEMLRRKHKLGGYFSFEITIYQMRRVFGGSDRFIEHFSNKLPFFYLTRDDIVLQSVSLAKAVNTSVFHSTGASLDDIVRSDGEFNYNPEEIGYWLEHIIDQERKCEDFFEYANITPIRLTYEEIMHDGAEVTARRFLKALKHRKADAVDLTSLASGHSKIGSDRNIDYANRFHYDRPEKISEINEYRTSILSRSSQG